MITKDVENWFPADYSPNFSVDDWVELLNDNEIFNNNSLEVMKRLKDYGGQATCKQLAMKYGKNASFYNAVSSSLAIRIAKKTNCPLLQENTDNSKWWPILYLGKYTTNKKDGVYIWKLRDELSEALDKVDLSKVELYVEKEEPINYWWLTINSKVCSFMNMSVGEEESYIVHNNEMCIVDNFIDMKKGDKIIGCETVPNKKIVAIGHISRDINKQKIYLVKDETLINTIDYDELKTFLEQNRIECLKNNQGNLFKLTKREYELIYSLIRQENPCIENDMDNINKYNKEDFLKEVFIDESKYNLLINLLKNKKNIILQGAPGVGKTFIAKRLAYSLMGKKDENRIELIQFHQNYSYEDFMMGYKPSNDGFSLKYGVFYNFCQKAANYPNKDFFFIIDEINRGNMSKIFGELLMLIENNYRGKKLTLAYNGCKFSVPENVYIIGMMNTADRSLAMIDYALRRRFSFFEIEPAFKNKTFIKYQNKLNGKFKELIDVIIDLNTEIMTDSSLGKGFCIGHSYFYGKKGYSDNELLSIIDYDILPMLKEYWFDDMDKVEYWENMLHGVFK